MAKDEKITGRVAEPNQFEAAATTLVGKLVDIGIDGLGPLSSARQVADKALREARGDVEVAVDDIVRSHGRIAAVGGFTTGVAGFTAIVVSVPANLVAFYAVATRMTAAIAHLRGYDVHQPSVRTEILLTLVGTDSRSVLARARIRGPRDMLTDGALGQLPAPALMLINKAIGMNLLSQFSRRMLSRLGRLVPVVGGAVGAGLDWKLLRGIGKDARTRFTA